MNENCTQFVRRFTELSDVLDAAKQEVFDHWKPDQPPMTILFAALGKEMARQFDAIDEDARQIAFQYIEVGMNSNDVVLKTAVASGLIEAMIAEASRSEELRLKIEAQLGAASQRHALAWCDGA
ncbi:hypothetical protein BH11PSE12_BH11PSE12_34370 [soil metagenome]